MALQFNKKVDIITSDDRIIRNVGYVFLKPYFSSKTEVEVECVLYSDKTDVFPESIITQDEEGNEIITISETKGPKGVLKVTVIANMQDTNVIEVIHSDVSKQLKELNSDISIITDAL